MAGMRVLVVDDSAVIRKMVQGAFRGTEFELIEAVDGVDGLERLGDATAPDLVLCDINMPRMNGLDMVTALRKDDRFASLPVVMLTTEARPELIARARAVGIKAWI